MSRSAGRRPGDSGTREAILAAAREQFARHGYDGATIRAIAADAHVDPALVHHFYGSKERLFTAALQFPFDASQVTALILDGGPREQAGERMIRFFLTVWGNPHSRAPFLAMIRSATVNDQAATAFRQFVTSALLARVAEPLGVSRIRLETAVAQMIGIALLRYVVRLEPMASATDEEVITLVAPLIQRILDGAISDQP